MRIKTNIAFLLLFSLFLCACSTQKHTVVVDENKVVSSNTIVSQKITIDTTHSTYLTPNTLRFEPLSPQTHYSNTLNELKAMLEGEQEANFKRAVFITENTFFENTLDYEIFSNEITNLALIAKKWSVANQLIDYRFADSNSLKLNAGIFYTLTDTVFNLDKKIVNVPYIYDFNDCFGRENWTNQFVTKLIITHKGNCHSLPFLYKIIAEELKVNAWLSFTPNHIYLRNWCKKTGWYNTELTNASLPNEGWIMASGFVSTASIVSGIYMDTLGLKQSIAVCVNDLAKGYARKMEKPDLNFILQCCDLGLKHYPNYAELLMLKAETHLKLFKHYEQTYGLNVQNESHPKSQEVRYHIREMEKTYRLLLEYDYREIPEEMFVEWISSLEDNKENYQNKEISNTFKAK